MEKYINDTINLSINNNTNLPQTVSILGGNQDVNAVPGTNLYSWDISGENYIGINFLVNIEVNGNPVYPIPTGVPLVSKNIQGVVASLNSIGVGTFKYYNTTIYISSSNTVYNRLYIY